MSKDEAKYKLVSEQELYEQKLDKELNESAQKYVDKLRGFLFDMLNEENLSEDTYEYVLVVLADEIENMPTYDEFFEMLED